MLKHYDIGMDMRHVHENNKLVSDEEYHNMVRSLNEKQRTLFDHVLFSLRLPRGAKLCNFLTGGAGVGKSVLIRCLTQAAMRWYATSISDADPSLPTILLMAFSCFQYQRRNSARSAEPSSEEINGHLLSAIVQ